MLKFKARLEKRRFFEQVRFGRKKSKQEIIKWLFWLEERQGITIGTFEQLLQGMEEIIFPVYIKVHLEKKEEYKFVIIDNEGTNFRLELKKENSDFAVTKSSQFTQERWKFEITQPSNIRISEYYKKTFTSEGEKNEIAILYKEQDVIKAAMREERKEALFKFNAGYVESPKEIIDVISYIQVDDYNDVFSTFYKLRNMLKNPDAITCIQAFVDNERVAEIAIEEGIVTKCTETTFFKSSVGTQTTRKSPNLSIDEFIQKNIIKLY